MYKMVISILVLGIVILTCPHPAKGTVAQEEEKTSTYVTLAAATLATADVITIFENTTALATGEPRKAAATVGIIAGVGSIALGGYVASVENNESLGIFLGITGGIALGLGAFGARLPEPAQGYGIENVRVGPTLIRDGDESLWGLGLSGRF